MNTKRTLILIGLLILVPVLAWAAASQLSTSLALQQQTSETRRYQLIRCDNSASITGDSAAGGETCEAGDWSVAIDCTGMTHLSARYFEYGAGSGEAKIWDCTESEGVSDALTTNPAEASRPSAADPAPLCADLTAGASVTLDGTTTTLMNLSNIELHYIIGGIHACTGNCDSTLVVSCGR
jgi:hypothetical protein